MAGNPENPMAGNHPEGIQRFVPKLPERTRRKLDIKVPRPVTIVAIHAGDQEVLKTSRNVKRVK